MLNSNGEVLYHLTTRDDWEAATRVGTYRMSTHGMTLDEVGFIHASTPSQLEGTAQRFYRDLDAELVVLSLDRGRLEEAGVPVRYEDAGNGEYFPHLYAPLPCELVEHVHAAKFDESGHFTMAD